MLKSHSIKFISIGIAALFLTLLLAVCVSSSVSAVSGPGITAIVGAVGDSITVGTPTPHGYPYYLGIDWDLTITNAAQNGIQTSTMITRLDSVILPLSPDYVIIMGGINDLRLGSLPGAVTTCEANLRYMYDEVISAGGRVIALTLLPMGGDNTYSDDSKDPYIHQVNGWITGQACYDIVVVDTHTALADPSDPIQLNPLYDQDGLHPNTAGQQHIASVIDSAFSSSSVPDWLVGFTYRKSHEIGASAGAGANYVVGVKAYYGSGTDGVETVAGIEFGKVYLNSSCETDFADVRFTASDGQTILAYWRENYSASNYANFWVNVSESLSTVSKIIYIYWGNPLAVTGSCGEATFQFFDTYENKVWYKHGLVIPSATTNDAMTEPSVLWDTNPLLITSTHAGYVFKMWYRHSYLDHDASQLMYAESNDGMNWTSSVMLSAVSQCYRLPFVTKIASTYYMMCGDDNIKHVDLYSSSDGFNWAMIKDNVLISGTVGSDWDYSFLGNYFLYKEGSTWYILYEACGIGPSNRYKVGLATSSDGLTFMKYASNPVMGDLYHTPGGPYLEKIGSMYYCWVHSSPGGGYTALPTDLIRYSSPDMFSWTISNGTDYLLIRELDDEGIGNSEGQIGDPTMVYALGNTWLFYEGVHDQLDHRGIMMARAGIPISQIVQTQENQNYTKEIKWEDFLGGDLDAMVVTDGASTITGEAGVWRTQDTIKHNFRPGLMWRMDCTMTLGGSSDYGTCFTLYNDANSGQIAANLIYTANAISCYDGASQVANTNLAETESLYDLYWSTGNVHVNNKGISMMNMPITTHVPANNDMWIGYWSKDLNPLTTEYLFVRPYIASEPEHDAWGTLETYSSGGAVTITSSPVTTGSVSVTYSYQLVATGTGITWSFTSDAGWLSIDPVTGLLNGTPTATGTFYVNITATSGIYSDTQNYILTINDLAWIDDTMNMIMALVPILLLLALLGVCIAVIGRRS